MSDDQFTKLDKKFDALSGQVADLNDLVMKLYQHTEKRFSDVHDEMDQRFEKNDARFDQVMSALDSVLKNQETEEQERLAMNAQLDRHEDWIERAGKQLGISYER